MILQWLRGLLSNIWLTLQGKRISAPDDLEQMPDVTDDTRETMSTIDPLHTDQQGSGRKPPNQNQMDQGEFFIVFIRLLDTLLQRIDRLQQRFEHQEHRDMALQDDLNKLQSDIAAYKQKQADAQTAEDTLEQGQASTLADLTTRVSSLETTGSPQIAELASQLQQVVGIVNQLVAQAPEVTTPVEPPTPPSENLSTGSRRRG